MTNIGRLCTRWMMRRKVRLMAIAGGFVVLALIGYGIFFCARNASIERGWEKWTSHLSGPPSSWQAPSNDLERFIATPLGEQVELYGYKNNEGDIVIEPKFSPCAKRFYHDLAWAWDPSLNRSGYIKPDGSWAIVVDGYTHSDFVGGMGQFQIIGEDGYPMYGFVNREGETVVPPKYRTAELYVDGYVLVRERTWVGKMVDSLALEYGAFPATCFDTRSFIIDKNGNKVSPPKR